MSEMNGNDYPELEKALSVEKQLLLINKKLDILLAALELDLTVEKKKAKKVNRLLKAVKKIMKYE